METFLALVAFLALAALGLVAFFAAFFVAFLAAFLACNEGEGGGKGGGRLVLEL